MADRPDYIVCVKHTHAKKTELAWCGRDVQGEFAFENIDHAAYTRLNRARLLLCPECRKAIIAELENDQ